MQVSSKEAKEELLRRLRRVEGQVRGVQRMLEEDRDCKEIVQQLSAIRSAVHQSSVLLMRSYASQCLYQSGGEERADLVEELIDMIAKAP